MVSRAQNAPDIVSIWGLDSQGISRQTPDLEPIKVQVACVAGICKSTFILGYFGLMDLLEPGSQATETAFDPYSDLLKASSMPPQICHLYTACNGTACDVSFCGDPGFPAANGKTCVVYSYSPLATFNLPILHGTPGEKLAEP